MIGKDGGPSENGLEALMGNSNHSHLHNHQPHFRKKSNGRIFVWTSTCFSKDSFPFTSSIASYRVFIFSLAFPSICLLRKQWPKKSNLLESILTELLRSHSWYGEEIWCDWHKFAEKVLVISQSAKEKRFSATAPPSCSSVFSCKCD